MTAATQRVRLEGSRGEFVAALCIEHQHPRPDVVQHDGRTFVFSICEPLPGAFSTGYVWLYCEGVVHFADAPPDDKASVKASA